MDILIIGGTGNISRQIVKQGIALGYNVTMVNRGSKDPEECRGAKAIIADRKAPGFESYFKGLSFDVVIDVICYDVPDAQQTLEIFADKAKQIIFTSSSAVYKRPPVSFPIDEDKEELTEDSSFPYGFKKANMERYLYTQMGKVGCAITIIRPSLTFGPGGANLGMLRQNRNLVRRIQEGRPVITMGEGVMPWAFTFTPDLAKGYLMSCLNERTYNDFFQVCSYIPCLWEDLYRAIGRAVGKEPKLCYIPSDVLYKVDPALFGHLSVEKKYFHVFAVDKFRRACPEFRIDYDLDKGVEMMIEWWKRNNFPFDDSKDRLEDRLCQEYERFTEAMSRINGD